MTQQPNTETQLNAVSKQIQCACQQSQRNAADVMLLAVSKRHSIDAIRQAFLCGQRHFGENYLQEALQKQTLLDDCDICWHYIGHIQSNKTRKIAENFSWVHTIEDIKTAQRLSKQRPEHLTPLNLCLQVNIDDEQSKSGVSPRATTLIDIAKAIVDLPHIKLRGLMCIPAPKANKTAEKETFSKMQQLMQEANQCGLKMDTLSMGMSADLDSAIACGATIVRVGTAIFGARD